MSCQIRSYILPFQGTCFDSCDTEHLSISIKCLPCRSWQGRERTESAGRLAVYTHTHTQTHTHTHTVHTHKHKQVGFIRYQNAKTQSMKPSKHITLLKLCQRVCICVCVFVSVSRVCVCVGMCGNVCVICVSMR